MPIARIAVDMLGPYTPYVDQRMKQEPGVIRGQNFSWDLAGVKSDFSSRLVAGDESIADYNDYVQSVKVGERQHVICGAQVYEFVPSSPGSQTGTWTNIAILTPVQTALAEEVPESLRSFTSIFVGGFAYVAGWNYGVYQVDLATNTYTRLETATTPGFPPDSDPVYAIAETNGRAIYLTATTAYFSAPNDAEDLVPSLGGAGAQVLSEFISGTPTSMLRVSTGVIIWTESGALAGEFVGGQFVFRWFQISTSVMPLNQSASVEMPDGSYLALTSLGLHSINSLGTPQLVTPLFSEFLREFLRNKSIESATLWYNQSDNRVFMGVRRENSLFVETFCLSVTLDRWGIFSVPHMGIIEYTASRGATAYVNTGGVVSHFLSAFDSRKNRESASAPGTFLGLDSYVEIGHFRAERLTISGGSTQELTDINIYRTAAAINLDSLVVDEGVIIGFTLPVVTPYDEGLWADVDGDTPVVDEGPFDNLNQAYQYKLYFISDLFETDPETGIGYGENLAYLASQRRLADAWTGSAVGNYMSVRLVANEVDEFFRCQTMDATVSFNGQMIGA